jgi:hypothetical protein
LNGINQYKDILPESTYIDIQKQLTAYIRLERWYSNKAGFLWINSSTPLEQQEKFVTRRSYLKKHVQKALYLDARTKPIFSFQLQLSGILAAASAGAWAVAADIIIRAKIINNQSFQTQIGVSGFLLLTAAIMAYVLKDRIKEVGRSYFRGTLFSKVPDNSNAITYHSPHGSDLTLGNVSEFTKFTTFNKLPSYIQKLKLLTVEQTTIDPEANERIIHYRKLITIDNATIQKLHQPVKAVHDILRFNVQEFLPRLDDPLHKEWAFEVNGKLNAMMMPKVYYLDVALRYSRYPKTENNEVSYEFLRLVLTKDGLSRVDRLHVHRTRVIKQGKELHEEELHKIAPK